MSCSDGMGRDVCAERTNNRCPTPATQNFLARGSAASPPPVLEPHKVKRSREASALRAEGSPDFQLERAVMPAASAGMTVPLRKSRAIRCLGRERLAAYEPATHRHQRCEASTHPGPQRLMRAQPLGDRRAGTVVKVDEPASGRVG